MKPFILGATLLVLGSSAWAQEKGNVVDFVNFQPFHGIEYDAAAQFGAEDVPALVRVLSDKSQSKAWAATVWVLGIIATQEAETALLAFLEDGATGEITPQELQAFMLVPPALGFRAQNPETRAFAFLRDSLEPEQTAQPRYSWSFKGLEPEMQSTLIAKQAVNGLGLASSPAAIQLLENLAERKDDRLWRFVAPNVEEALPLAREIQKLGYSETLRSKVQTRVPRTRGRE